LLKTVEARDRETKGLYTTLDNIMSVASRAGFDSVGGYDPGGVDADMEKLLSRYLRAEARIAELAKVLDLYCDPQSGDQVDIERARARKAEARVAELEAQLREQPTPDEVLQAHEDVERASENLDRAERYLLINVLCDNVQGPSDPDIFFDPDGIDNGE